MSATLSNVAQANQAALPLVREFIEFVNKAVTPFHAVTELSRMLEVAGYKQVRETEVHNLRDPNGRYFMTRNQSTIVALSVGGKYQAGNAVLLAGAHSDSPNLALKPRSKLNKNDHVGVGVQLYGGILLHTWFDRDLTVAGRVILQAKEEGQPLTSRLVHIKKPILRIPNLAIHLTTMDERSKGFSPNTENNTIPILATEAMTKAVGQQLEENGHCGPLIAAIAKEIGCETTQIVDFDLSIVDTQPAAITGLYDEFVVAPRIDNLLSCFCATKALIRSDETSQKESDKIAVVAIFDHEEVGSTSSPGAHGSLIPDVIDRITSGLTTSERAALIAKSYFLSVDGAHAFHPNYAERHNNEHRPLLHRGPVIKYNCNQKYATSGITSAILMNIAKKANVPMQQFVVKNDSPCGSTIGNVVASLSGIASADIGNPMWSMHSIRETCGTVDVDYLEKFLKAFFEEPAANFIVKEVA